MKDLTDKWKKGELESGWYWVEGSRAEGIYAYTAEYLNNMYRPRNSEKIIEQVPSYHEWQASEKYNKHLEVEIKEKETQRIELMTRLNDVNNENHALEIENAKLKELLKDLRDEADGALQAIQKDCESDCFSIFQYPEVQYFYNLLNKIDNTIGEKK